MFALTCSLHIMTNTVVGAMYLATTELLIWASISPDYTKRSCTEMHEYVSAISIQSVHAVIANQPSGFMSQMHQVSHWSLGSVTARVLVDLHLHFVKQTWQDTLEYETQYSLIHNQIINHTYLIIPVYSQLTTNWRDTVDSPLTGKLNVSPV